MSSPNHLGISQANASTLWYDFQTWPIWNVQIKQSDSTHSLVGCTCAHSPLGCRMQLIVFCLLCPVLFGFHAVRLCIETSYRIAGKCCHDSACLDCSWGMAWFCISMKGSLILHKIDKILTFYRMILANSTCYTLSGHLVLLKAFLDPIQLEFDHFLHSIGKFCLAG